MVTRKAATQTRQTPSHQTTTLRQLRPERGQSFVALLFPPTFEAATKQLKVYRSIRLLAKNTASKVTVSTLLQRIINLGLNLSGIIPITAAVP